MKRPNLGPAQVVQCPPSASAIERTYVPEPTVRSSRATPPSYPSSVSSWTRIARSGHLHRDSLAVQAVGTLPVDLHRRGCRNAELRPCRGSRRGPSRAPADPALRARRAASPSGSPVVVRARRSIDCEVALVQLHETILQARRATREQDEQAGRERVERPGMPGSAPVRRRTAATIANDVGPAGLSTRMIPVGSTPRGIATAYPPSR